MASKNVDYEVMVIFKPLLPDDVRKSSHNAIVDLAKELGGEITDADVWGKRYLAYPIKNHDEGYYIVYQMELAPDAVEDFRKRVNDISEILRFMVTKSEGKKKKKKLNKKVMEI
jgi:small subunit ribosomal protein S6